MKRRSLFLLLGFLAFGVAVFLLVFHPSRPLRMRHRSIDVVSADGIRLAATLSLPRWRRGPLPAFVIVHGSGRSRRADSMVDNRRLVRAGFAVLTYDKRGVGESEGEYPTGWGPDAERVLQILAQDAAAAFERVRRERDIDPTRVGFFGASQAGWIIPLAATELDPPPRFQVVLSGAAVSTGIEEFYSGLTGDGHRTPMLTDSGEIEVRVAQYSGPVGFDPRPLLERSRVPTLWLLGARDMSVPTQASVRVLESIRATGNDAYTVIVYPDVDHGLRSVVTGAAAPVWDDLAHWLKRTGIHDARASR